MGPLPNGRNLWLRNGGDRYPLTSTGIKQPPVVGVMCQGGDYVILRKVKEPICTLLLHEEGLLGI